MTKEWRAGRVNALSSGACKRLKDWRAGPVNALVLLVAALLTVLQVNVALAHPVPSENHDRTILVRLTPTAVVVNYRLEVDEARAIRDIPMGDRTILPKVQSQRDFHEAYCRYFAAIL